MLERLILENVALVERAEIEFSEGLNVLSGETGAGKSVILDALDFVLGAKADKSMIRYGADGCLVRAEFCVSGKDVEEILEELDASSEDGLILITRKLTKDGKGGIRVNGVPVTSSMLKKLTGKLVDVHGQSEHFYLLKESNQLRLLDKAAGEPVEQCKEELSTLLEERKKLLEGLALFGGDAGERDRRIDILRFQIEEIGAAELREGEEEELLATRDKLQHAEKIVEGLKSAACYLSADGGGVDSVQSARRSVGAISAFGSEYSDLCDRLENAAAEIEDILSTCEELGDGIDLDGREAERVENRLDEIRLLKKKYGGSVEKVQEFYEKAQSELELLSGSEEKYKELTAKLQKANKAIFAVCEKLTKARKAAAQAFAERVTKELETLNIPSATFEIGFEKYAEEDVSRANREGLDHVTFLFSANAGEPVKELGKIISGGEMSRFMLAVKAQLSFDHEIGTYVFDEIDAGIGGRTAQVVAEKFMKISRNTQVIAVSHLARIAAAADREFLIEKIEKSGKTRSTVREVKGEERLKELSRIIGDESKFALSHAEELLALAEQYKKSLI